MNVVGIDIGGTNVDIGILDNDGQILKAGSIPTQSEDGPESVFARTAEKITALISEAGLIKDDIAGVGCGCAGPTDTAAGWMVHSPNFPESWVRFPIAEHLKKLVGLPVAIDNDANAATLAELWAGQAKGLDDFILLTLGTGIGGGIVANGRIVRGSTGLGGEIGHMTVYPGGERCGCGNAGCLETYASATGMTNIAKRLLAAPDYQDGSSPLQGVISKKSGVKAIFDNARAGDPLAVRVVKQAGDALGIGIGTLLNLLNPQKVLLSGRIALSFDLLSPHIHETCRKHAFEAIVGAVSIEATSLGEHTGLIGAAAVFAYESGSISKS